MLHTNLQRASWTLGGVGFFGKPCSIPFLTCLLHPSANQQRSTFVRCSVDTCQSRKVKGGGLTGVLGFADVRPDSTSLLNLDDIIHPTLRDVDMELIAEVDVSRIWLHIHNLLLFTKGHVGYMFYSVASIVSSHRILQTSFSSLQNLDLDSSSNTLALQLLPPRRRSFPRLFTLAYMIHLASLMSFPTCEVEPSKISRSSMSRTVKSSISLPMNSLSLTPRPGSTSMSISLVACPSRRIRCGIRMTHTSTGTPMSSVLRTPTNEPSPSAAAAQPRLLG